MQTSGYKLVRLASGVQSVHSLEYRETFHPVIGPAAEAEALYVHQLRLPDRLRDAREEFVVWDIGLGAAANVLTVLRAAEPIPGRMRILSFDQTLEPLRFALQHAADLGYVTGHETEVQRLLEERSLEFARGALQCRWEVCVGDFPALVHSAAAEQWPRPHAILFDAFSPARNPVMWTQPLFARIFSLLDPARPCGLPTYSRSTMLRVSLLLAGFFVGVGHPTGEKEETTIAANTLELIEEPLGTEWLQRVRRSTSAEPLWTAEYRQAPLSERSWQRLVEHPQFRRVER